jgi:hypothetical protein
MKSKTYRSKKKNFWGKLTVILFGLILTGALIFSIFQKYGEYTFGAVIFTALFWSTIEILTPKGEHIGHAFLRFTPALILGIIFGGVLTYYTQFGYYIIQPALSGNPFGIFALITLVFAVLVIVWNAVWSHNHQYIAFRR